MRTERTGLRARFGPALLTAGLALALTGCSGSVVQPSSSPSDSRAPAPTMAGLPAVPASAFPGVDCDALVPADRLVATLGGGAARATPTIDEAALVQDGGVVCTWNASAGSSLSVRLVGAGADHWAAFNHWYEHTDWRDSVGEINGTSCTADGCAVHALDGDRFLEVETTAKGIGDDAIEALAREVLSAAPAPQPPAPTTAAPGSRSCTAALPVATALDVLDTASPSSADPQPSYVSTSTPNFELREESLRRVGGLDCRLLSGDGDELLSFTILRGGTWVFRDDSPISRPGEVRPADDPLVRIASTAPDDMSAQHDDDWLRVTAPGADEETLRSLLVELSRG